MNVLRGGDAEQYMHDLIRAQVDITGADIVDVNYRRDEKVLWVNVNGVCVLRVCQIDLLVVTKGE